MTAFTLANDLLFSDPNLSVPALWKSGGDGAGVPVQVILRAPDEEVRWNEARLVVGVVWVEVRMSDVPQLEKGDTFTIGSRVLTVLGEPRSDDLNLTWRAEARD